MGIKKYADLERWREDDGGGGLEGLVELAVQVNEEVCRGRVLAFQCHQQGEMIEKKENERQLFNLPTDSFIASSSSISVTRMSLYLIHLLVPGFRTSALRYQRKSTVIRHYDASPEVARSSDARVEPNCEEIVRLRLHVVVGALDPLREGLLLLPKGIVSLRLVRVKGINCHRGALRFLSEKGDEKKNARRTIQHVLVITGRTLVIQEFDASLQHLEEVHPLVLFASEISRGP